MAHPTIWIQCGNVKIGRPRIGARIVEPERTRVAKKGDMMEQDEHGDVYLIPAAEAEESRRKYDRGAAKLEPEDGDAANDTPAPSKKKPKKKSRKSKRKPAKKKGSKRGG